MPAAAQTGAVPGALAISLALVVACALAVRLGERLARTGHYTPAGERIGQIDGLRGFLALAVFGYHYAVSANYHLTGAWTSVHDNFLRQLGATGVGLFFMVTGCLFYPLVQAGALRANWVRFAIARVFRVVPLLFASVVAVSALVMLRTGSRPDVAWFGEAMRWIAGDQDGPLLGDKEALRINAGVLWTIRYEWMFYLFILPASSLLALVTRRRSWLIPLAIMAMVQPYSASETHDTIRVLPLFAAGMLACEARFHPALAAILRTRTAAAISSGLLLTAMLAYRNIYGGLPLMLAFPFMACIVSGNDIFGLLSSRGARALGEISYGIYLLHGIVLHLVFTALGLSPQMLGQPLLTLPLLAALTVALSALAHITIEKPGIAAGKALYRALVVGFSRFADTPTRNAPVRRPS